MASSQIIWAAFDSKALANNPLGDPASRPVPVYLPPSYENGSQRYPVVFLLAGYSGKGAHMLAEAAWDETIQQRMDRLISEGSCQPMILVLPDCFTRLGGSQYLNSSAVGNYSDYLLELVAHVDRHFRTLPDRDHRAIAGKSSGGYGALVNAMLHPEIWGLVADHSGDKYFELCYKPDIPKFLRSIQRFKDLKKLLSAPEKVRPRGSDFFQVMNLCAMAACYSPNPNSELGFDLPFDTYSGELNARVWAQWVAMDPIHMVEQYVDTLKSLRLLFIDCGSRDEYNLLYGCRILSQRLDKWGIEHRYEEFDDGHRSTQYRYDISLSAISDCIHKR